VAQLAHDSLLGHMRDTTEYIFANRNETSWLGEEQQEQLASAFIDIIFGTDFLRVLLGLSRQSTDQVSKRAQQTGQDLVVRVIAEAKS
jgi:hypothetical protein